MNHVARLELKALNGFFLSSTKAFYQFFKTHSNFRRHDMSEAIDRLISQADVADWTGMSKAWLEQSRFRGTGIPYVKIGKAVRYRTSDVQRFINEHVISAGI
jgi:predicted DNA-binding transcriptional regulator AlpA